ncbi:MAG: hypothetical protein PHX82_08575 [Paracoccaceae bacterium]|nr:hypothetical protein [Paracoccaceae bacterium]
MFQTVALLAAILGLLLPEFPTPLRAADGTPCPQAAQIGPTLALLFAPMLVRLTRHTRKATALEYVLLGLALTPFVLGLILGDCVSLQASLAARNTPLVLLIFAIVALVAVAARLGSDDACRLPVRRAR